MNNFVISLVDNFSSCVWLAVILVAMIPTLESKIAIPLGMNFALWGSNALSPLSACLLGFLGSIIPAYIIIVMGRSIKKHTSLLLHSRMFKKYSIKSEQLHNRMLNKYMSLIAFVAIPIPLTGVWSGSLIAGLSNLNIHYAFLSIAIGALSSCAVITSLCYTFKNSLSYIIIVALVIIIVFLFADLLLSQIKHRKKSGT